MQMQMRNKDGEQKKETKDNNTEQQDHCAKTKAKTKS